MLRRLRWRAAKWGAFYGGLTLAVIALDRIPALARLFMIQIY